MIVAHRGAEGVSVAAAKRNARVLGIWADAMEVTTEAVQILGKLA